MEEIQAVFAETQANIAVLQAQLSGVDREPEPESQKSALSEEERQEKQAELDRLIGVNAELKDLLDGADDEDDDMEEIQAVFAETQANIAVLQAQLSGVDYPAKSLTAGLPVALRTKMEGLLHDPDVTNLLKLRADAEAGYHSGGIEAQAQVQTFIADVDAQLETRWQQLQQPVEGSGPATMVSDEFHVSILMTESEGWGFDFDHQHRAINTVPSSSAAQQGVRDFDQLIQMAGVAIRSPANFETAIQTAEPLIRDSKAVDFLFARASLPNDEAEEVPIGREFIQGLKKNGDGFGIGLGAHEIKRSRGAEFATESYLQLVVTSLVLGCEAEQTGVEIGDEVLRIHDIMVDGKGMKAVSEAAESMDKLKTGTIVEWCFGRLDVTDDDMRKQMAADNYGDTIALGVQEQQGGHEPSIDNYDLVSGALSPGEADERKLSPEERELTNIYNELTEKLAGTMDPATIESLQAMLADCESALSQLHPQTPRQAETDPRREYVEGVLLRAGQEGENPYDALFATVDLDGDGTVDRPELYQLCETMDAWAQGLTTEFFDAVVRDHHPINLENFPDVWGTLGFDAPEEYAHGQGGARRLTWGEDQFYDNGMQYPHDDDWQHYEDDFTPPEIWEEDDGGRYIPGAPYEEEEVRQMRQIFDGVRIQ